MDNTGELIEELDGMAADYTRLVDALKTMVVWAGAVQSENERLKARVAELEKTLDEVMG